MKSVTEPGLFARRMRETLFRLLFLLTACFSAVAVLVILLFLLSEGMPAFFEIGFFEFLGGLIWKPTADLYGILPMIVGSLAVTAGAILAGVPLALLTAVFLARFCPLTLYRPVKSVIRLLAGIPSVVYGFFGLVVMVPLMQDFGGSGKGLLTASLLLGIMILPTVTEVAENSLHSVTNSYYEGALALGATSERAVFTVMFPAARQGLLSAIVLGIGRAVGEATAVVMVAGNQPIIPNSLLAGVRTLTANIALEMSYATDLHFGALVATGITLFVFVLLTNLALAALRRMGEKR